MMRKIRSKKKKDVLDIDTHHVRWSLAGFGFAITLTIIGCGFALIQERFRNFLEEWIFLQGFFLSMLGVWLFLIIRAKVLHSRIANLVINGSLQLGLLNNTYVRVLVVVSIGVAGTISLGSMGFDASGVLLVFMWITCSLVCFTAGLVTLHTLEILVAIHNLQRQDIKVFRYAPARTPELKCVVKYFSSFGLLMTIGYAFALLGTLKAHWIGPKEYIEAIRLFWPVIYVPICSTILIYPHVIVHKIIQREKERTLQSCQSEMDNLLSKYAVLKTEDIDRTNTLAQLFDRITATPNYVIDVGIGIQTILPLFFNLISLFVKFLLDHKQLP